MLGQAERGGKLNPETGHSAEAVLPVFQSPLNQFGAIQSLRNTLAVPWAYTRAGRGIHASATAKDSDALSNVSNKPSEINIYQMPTIIVSYQMPNNSSQLGQSRRLPLNMVAPKLAWSPS